jgi:hypothetical protein
MAVVAGEVQIYLSGGAANSDPNLSLGGIISSTQVTSQDCQAPVNVNGVVINNAFSNLEGNGTLYWFNATNQLAWQAPGQGTYVPVTITGDGQYTLGGSSGYLIVTATLATLQAIGSDQTDTLAITYQANKVYDDISKNESLAGDIEYRCLYIKNINGVDPITDVKLFLKAQPTGPDELDIGLDPAGVGDGSTTGVATTAADEGTAPAGVSFSRPSTSASGLAVGTLASNACAAFWIRRTIAADNDQVDLTDQSSIGISGTV